MSDEQTNESNPSLAEVMAEAATPAPAPAPAPEPVASSPAPAPAAAPAPSGIASEVATDALNQLKAALKTQVASLTKQTEDEIASFAEEFAPKLVAYGIRKAAGNATADDDLKDIRLQALLKACRFGVALQQQGDAKMVQIMTSAGAMAVQLLLKAAPAALAAL